MLRAWAIFAGITLLGCKGQDAPKPAEAPPAPPGAAPTHSAPAPTPTPTGPAAPSAPALPRLDPATTAAEFDKEVEDRDWAPRTERAIKAAAPELTDVDCKERSCRATLSAASADELARKADELEREDSLRGTSGAQRLMLTAPETVDGTLRMKIYVRYSR